MSLFSVSEEDQKLNSEIISRFTRINSRGRIEPLMVLTAPTRRAI